MRGLRLLRWMVTVLTATMILGLLAIVALLVIRLSATPEVLPEALALPAGATARAFTRGEDWLAVVTDADEILIYDRATGALRQRIAIRPAQ